MQLIGQYDSPFVRRVAVALRLYGMDYEHLPWSTFGDAEKLARFNPLRRVPVLVLDDGTALIESGAILDYLDNLASPEKALVPRSGESRYRQLRIAALATGLADKAVSFFYSRVFHAETSTVWVARCHAQIHDVLELLERECGALSEPWWNGSAPGHADIAIACVLRFLGEAHPGLFDAARYPALGAHCARCEAMTAFSGVVQAFSPPK